MEENKTLNEYRKDLKQKILDLAGKRFFTEGIKNVKMDDIARALVISKRTLYELYPTKEHLLLACVKLFHEREHEKLKANIGKSANVMDILAAVYLLNIEKVSVVNPSFYDDINRYSTVHEYLKEEASKRAEKSEMFFRQGVKQGFFLPDINTKILNDMAQFINSSIIKNRLYFTYSVEEIYRHSLMMFVRGFCTEKGVKAMDKILGIC